MSFADSEQPPPFTWTHEEQWMRQFVETATAIRAASAEPAQILHLAQMACLLLIHMRPFDAAHHEFRLAELPLRWPA